MRMKKTQATKDKGFPIVVVSDTHFGRGLPSKLSCRPREFARFVDWLLLDRTVLLEAGPGLRVLSWEEALQKLPFPRKMILLGDMLELWAPLRDSLVFERAYAPLAKLEEIGAKGCELIYVAGNHDYTLSEYDGDLPAAGAGEAPSLSVIKEDEWCLIEPYVFLHGHRLAKAFRYPVWRILGFIQRLVAAFDRTLKLVILFSFFLTLVASFFSRAETLIEISYVLGALSVIIIVREAAFPAWMLSKRLAKLVEDGREWLYGKTRRRPQHKEFAQIIGEGSLQQWWDDNKSKFSRKPEFIVFGHTHMYDGPTKVEDVECADLSRVDDELRKKVLINTGCWLDEEDEEGTCFLFLTEDQQILCAYDADRNLGVELDYTLKRYSSRRTSEVIKEIYEMIGKDSPELSRDLQARVTAKTALS